MKPVLLAAVAALTLTGVSFGQNNSGGSSRPSFDKDYADVVQRNPFSRERHAPRPPRDREAENRMRNEMNSRRTARYVLRGVAIEDDELHAYLEPTRGGEMRRVAPGDAFENGRIVGIAIDAIAYESNGETKWIEIGQDLTGARGETVSSSSNTNSSQTPAAGTTQPTATPSADNSLPAEGGSLAERMRARARSQRGNR